MEKVARIYKDPANTSRNPKLLAERAGVSVPTARKFLSQQIGAIINEKHVKPPPGSAKYSPAGDHPDYWQADVIFFEKYKSKNLQHKAILTVLNTTTRYALARPLKSKDAESTCKALENILDEIKKLKKKIIVLRVDGGSEFKGETQELLEKRGILVERAEKYTHGRLRRTDAFHRTLRLKIGDHFEDEETDKWIDALPGIVENINKTANTTLNHVLGKQVSPLKVTKKDEEKIHAHEMKLVQKTAVETAKLKIVMNFTRAHLLVSSTKEGILERHAKTNRAVWTRETYKFIKQTGPNSFELDVPQGEVKIWQPHSLKILSEEESSKQNDLKEPVLLLSTGKWLKPIEGPAKKSKKRINKAAVTAKALEERNISAKEQKAALVSTRTRGSGVATRSRKKVDYRGLAGLK